MTPANLILKLQEYLQGLLEGYFYEYEGKMLPVKVFAGWAPERTRAEEDILPCVCILPTKIEDVIDNNQENGAICTVRILVGTKEDLNADSWLSIVNLIEHIRQGLLKSRILARKFALRGKIITEFDEVQARPLYYAGLTVQYNIAQLVPERKV